MLHAFTASISCEKFQGQCYLYLASRGSLLLLGIIQEDFGVAVILGLSTNIYTVYQIEASNNWQHSYKAAMDHIRPPRGGSAIESISALKLLYSTHSFSMRSCLCHTPYKLPPKNRWITFDGFFHSRAVCLNQWYLYHWRNLRWCTNGSSKPSPPICQSSSTHFLQA